MRLETAFIDFHMQLSGGTHSTSENYSKLIKMISKTQNVTFDVASVQQEFSNKVGVHQSSVLISLLFITVELAVHERPISHGGNGRTKHAGGKYDCRIWSEVSYQED